VTIDDVSHRQADDREPGVQIGSSGMEPGAILIPTPIVVTCTTSSGSLDMIVSPADVAIVDGFFQKMTR
jgi:hypothetical protein